MKINSSLYKKLEQIGLSNKEALVYVALLELGDMVGSGKVITKTGLHGQFVYGALASLEASGLVRVAMVRGRKKFAANPPSGITELVKRTHEIAKDVEQELLLLTGKEHTQDFQVFQGKESYVANEFSLLEQAKEHETWRIIGGSGDIFMELLGHEFPLYDEERNKKHITILYLSTEDQKDVLPQASHTGFSIRGIKGYTKNNTNTLIRPENVSINSFSKPVLAYYLYSKETAEGYQNFFDALWEISK